MLKMSLVALAAVGLLASGAQAKAKRVCMKDGAEIEAADKAACKTAGGKWKKHKKAKKAEAAEGEKAEKAEPAAEKPAEEPAK